MGAAIVFVGFLIFLMWLAKEPPKKPPRIIPKRELDRLNEAARIRTRERAYETRWKEQKELVENQGYIAAPAEWNSLNGLDVTEIHVLPTPDITSCNVRPLKELTDK